MRSCAGGSGGGQQGGRGSSVGPRPSLQLIMGGPTPPPHNAFTPAPPQVPIPHHPPTPSLATHLLDVPLGCVALAPLGVLRQQLEGHLHVPVARDEPAAQVRVGQRVGRLAKAPKLAAWGKRGGGERRGLAWGEARSVEGRAAPRHRRAVRPAPQARPLAAHPGPAAACAAAPPRSQTAPAARPRPPPASAPGPPPWPPRRAPWRRRPRRATRTTSWTSRPGCCWWGLGLCVCWGKGGEGERGVEAWTAGLRAARDAPPRAAPPPPGARAVAPRAVAAAGRRIGRAAGAQRAGRRGRRRARRPRGRARGGRRLGGAGGRGRAALRGRHRRSPPAGAAPRARVLPRDPRPLALTLGRERGALGPRKRGAGAGPAQPACWIGGRSTRRLYGGQK
jgi:hypothetical protein